MLRFRMLPAVRVAKRTIDIVAAAAGLALVAPLVPIIAAAIYVDSPGPILYRQRRAGSLRAITRERGVRRLEFDEFHMHKFRTMVPDAEAKTGAILAGADDPRITRVGRFLRRSRLDELPQFWDVLRGKMSLVGPRPERPELLRDLSYAIPLFEERMRDVKPGITGLAQISLGYTGKPLPHSSLLRFEGDLTNPFKVDGAEDALADHMRMKLLYDLAYSAATEDLKAFLILELGIILRTPLVMLGARGT